MKRRILSLILVVVMILSILSVAAMAANDPIITSHHYGESYEADDFYIKWNAVSGANRYRLAVKSLNDDSYAADIYWDDRLTTNKYRVDEDNIKPGHTYKIWVGACGSSHENVISQYSIVVTAMESEDDDYYEPYYNEDYYYDDGYDDDYYDDGYNDKYYGNYDEEEDEEEYFYNDTSTPWDGGGFGNDDNGNFSNTPQQGSDETNADGNWIIVEPVHEHTYIDYYNNHTEYELIEGNETYHYYINYFDRKCAECGDVYEYDIEDDKKKETHTFKGLKCEGCDYTKVCYHTGGTYNSYQKTKLHEIIPGDDQFHMTTTSCNVICNTCSEIVERNKVISVGKEWHNYVGTSCSVCKYQYVWKPTYEVEQLLNQYPIVLPFHEYGEAVYDIAFVKKNDWLENGKAFMRRSWSEKVELLVNLIENKVKGDSNAYGVEMYEVVLLDILAQATGRLSESEQINNITSLFTINQDGTETLNNMTDHAIDMFKTNPTLQRPFQLIQTAGSWLDLSLKTGQYTYVAYQCFAQEYEQNAKYLLLMSDFIKKTNDPMLIQAMNNIVDDFVNQYENRWYGLQKELPNLVWDISEGILDHAGVLKGINGALGFFAISDFAQGALYAFTDIDERLEASEKLGFSYVISLAFENGFYEKGQELKKDGFDSHDNNYMLSAFELCRAVTYMNYKYLSDEYTDAGNQAWINEAIQGILGKSIKSYLY